MRDVATNWLLRKLATSLVLSTLAPTLVSCSVDALPKRTVGGAAGGGAGGTPSASGGTASGTAATSSNTGGSNASLGGAGSTGTAGGNTSAGAAGTDAGAGGSSGESTTWSPRSLANVALWLDAATGVTRDTNGGVEKWDDQSGQQNHASQTAPVRRPKVAANSIFGKPGIVFDGKVTRLEVNDSSSLQWGTGDFAILAVAKFKGDPKLQNEQMVYTKWEYEKPWIGPQLIFNPTRTIPNFGSAQLMIDENNYVNSRDTTLNNDEPHLYAALRIGRKLQVRVDGFLEGETVLSRDINVDAANRNAFIGKGNDPTGIQSLDGHITELIAIGSPLAETDRDKLETYLLDKYGLPRRTK